MDAELKQRVWRAVPYPPLAELGDEDRSEFQVALLEARDFNSLFGIWQAALLEAESRTKRDPADKPTSARVGSQSLGLKVDPGRAFEGRGMPSPDV